MRFQHDCDQCIPLGMTSRADLYFCPKEPTVIARYSDEGGDYSSGICFADRHPDLAEAKKLARAKFAFFTNLLADAR